MNKGRTPKQLAKFLSYVLGRRPDEFGLVPDASGRVKIKDLLKAVCEEDGWRYVRRSHINEVLVTLAKPPVAVADGCISATDRTHLPTEKTVLDPPKLLYACVRRRAWAHVLEKGIYPSAGRLVLSQALEMARRIGRRSDPDPVTLTVNTASAMENGVVFYRSGEGLFTVGFLPRGCFTGPPLPKEKPEIQKKNDRLTGKTERTPGSFLLQPAADTEKFVDNRRKQRKKEVAWKKGRRQLKKMSGRQ